MKLFKNFFQFATLVLAATFFASPQLKADNGETGLKIQMHVEPQAAAYIKFDGIDGECVVREGRNTVGTNTRTGEKLVVIVKNGKLAGFGLQPAQGSFKALTPNSAPCNPTLSCTTFNPPKCYTLPSGECVCVCGPWITSNPGRN